MMLKSQECAGEQGEFLLPTANVSLLRRSKQFAFEKVQFAFEKVLFGRPAKFSRAADAFVRGDVRDHIGSHKNDHRPSDRRYRPLQLQQRPGLCFRKIFGVVRLSKKFETISAQGGCLPEQQRQPGSAKCGPALVTGTKETVRLQPRDREQLRPKWNCSPLQWSTVIIVVIIVTAVSQQRS
jgi:hypothetical protein